MAGLLAAQRSADAHHFFEDILISHRCAQHADAVPRQSFLEPQIGHYGRDHDVARQMPGGFERTRGDEQHRVTVHDLAAAGDKNSAVGIAVECHSGIGPML